MFATHLFFLRRAFLWILLASLVLVVVPGSTLRAQGASIEAQQGAVIFSIFPQIALGDGWTGDLFINNQGTAPANGIQLTFFDGDGFPLAVTTEQGTGSAFFVDLEAGATRTFRLSSNVLKTGYALLRSPAFNSVRAGLNMRLQQGNAVTSTFGVTQQFPRAAYSFPAEVDSSAGVNTGIALALPSFITAAAQQIVVALINQAGDLMDWTLVPLDSGDHLARFLDELFPGLDNFRGTVSVSCATRFGVLPLRSDSFAFGTVNVHPGSVPGAFLLDQAITSEDEPNDIQAFGQDLSLPAIVGAGFDVPGDEDWFRFAGTAGDVVTILTTTQLLFSPADTVLTLIMPNGQEVSSNDQNGLINDNDSFLQLVLPASGTYGIKVEDFFGQGGAANDYDLHVQILGGGQQGPVPTLDSVIPGAALQGTMVTLHLQGENLAPVTAIHIEPSTGLTIGAITEATATSIAVNVTIAGNASPGQRQLTVETPSGTSNSQPFEVIQSSNGDNAPVISNLSVGTPSLNGSTATIHFSFHFEDADGDIVYTGAFATSAQLAFASAGGCSANIAGTTVNKPGQMSGTFNFNLVIQGSVANSKEVTIQLLDAAGHESNKIAFTPSRWSCN